VSICFVSQNSRDKFALSITANSVKGTIQQQQSQATKENFSSF